MPQKRRAADRQKIGKNQQKAGFHHPGKQLCQLSLTFCKASFDVVRKQCKSMRKVHADEWLAYMGIYYSSFLC
ncbi:MAG: hypothetical protein ACK524_15540, partial [Planctomyces sp.]